MFIPCVGEIREEVKVEFIPCGGEMGEAVKVKLEILNSLNYMYDYKFNIYIIIQMN